jgi:hypothetical protein
MFPRKSSQARNNRPESWLRVSLVVIIMVVIISVRASLFAPPAPS